MLMKTVISLRQNTTPLPYSHLPSFHFSKYLSDSLVHLSFDACNYYLCIYYLLLSVNLQVIKIINTY